MPPDRVSVLSEEYFKILIEKECSRSARYAEFFSVLKVETEGEIPENLLESEITRLIQQVLRASDILGMVHGKRLAAFLPHVDVQGITQVIERIQESLQARFNQESKEKTMKISGTCFPTQAVTPQELLSGG